MAAPQNRELKIDLLAPKSLGFMFQPTGVTVSGFSSPEQNGPVRELAVSCVIAFACELSVNILGNYVYDQVRAWKAKRVRINGREPKDDDDLRRIIAEEIEVGKND